ncbi:M1 family metallopeptidase [Robiginitomaculum antarcticum]|uniref:M1 family metallopeptidase n=1 Tax=Robiginitomaculum antarcticum TaxID=437507 RepID=UPI00036C46E0|nr:M1 family metallopeptidase [Robiginitomaculum antarcticum]
MISFARAALLSVMTLLFSIILIGFAQLASADGPAGNPKDQVAKFRQLGPESLPTPNIFRNAAGAPGPAYWQQKADYVINVRLDDKARRIYGSEVIRYTNNSPDELRYLWVSLDQNRFAEGSTARMSETASTSGTRRSSSGSGDSLSFNALARQQALSDVDYGAKITTVKDSRGNVLPFVINDTMMRIDLPGPLAPGQTFTFGIDWDHAMIDEAIIGGRGGFERFAENDTYIYFLAQWFPRMAAYTDYTGWQNKQFLGRGEFTLEFGDYEVNITVPDDHIVSATGVLQNPRKVLSSKQRRRLSKARNADAPVFVVTPEEAKDNENKEKSTKMTTWSFKAENVRDFSWSSSRKFIWDAQGFKQESDDNPLVLAMSFYPKEAEPIWSQYSTQAVIHTMDIYNRFSFPYPYPTAQSVNTWERGGMEYPMITFNGYRPSKDEKTGDVTYSRNIKYGLIGVIVHEVGHIYFPMTVNSDERRWTWMDEGINSFLEYLAEYEWEENFPISRGQNNPLEVIPAYMTSTGQVPIMTQSDSILQFGPNAYSKPAASLMVLRETVMGRELFDHAFKEYSRRWKFKRPTPADFFRTMEDASAVDLDWFWRGWYFGTDYVDIGITSVREYKISTQDPDTENPMRAEQDRGNIPETITQRRNREEGRVTRLERHPELNDFYTENDEYTVSNKDKNSFKKFIDGLDDWERDAYNRAVEKGQSVYFIDFENVGGLITPIPLRLTYEDNTIEEMMIPAEIWRRDSTRVSKLLIRDKRVQSIEVDAYHQTADADFSNNSYPAKISSSRLELYKGSRTGRDLMADMLEELKVDDKDAPETGEADTEVPITPQQ